MNRYLTRFCSRAAERETAFRAAVYIAVFLFWLWIFYNTPYMNDDWYWGRSWGIRTTLTGSTNSRYLGNLCIVLLTRSTAFKILFPTVLVWLLHFCISRFPAELEEKHRLLIFLFSNLMLFLAEPSIWNQTIGWLAGFANYMTSGFCLVALLMIVRKSFRAPERFSAKRTVLVFLFTFASGLFMEHLTIYFVLLSLAALVMALFLKKNIRTAAAMLSAALVSMLVMFTGPSYQNIYENGGSQVRELSFKGSGSLTEVIRAVLKRMLFHLPGMYERNLFLCLAVLLVLTLLSITVLKGRTRLAICFSVLNAALSAALLVKRYAALPGFLTDGNGASRLSLIFLLLTCAELLVLLLLSQDKHAFLDLGFLWLSTFIVASPLALTTTSGGRLYLCVVILSGLFLAEGYAYLVKQGVVGKKSFLTLAVSLSAACLILAATTANVYRVIGQIDRWQMEIIDQARENKDPVIYIPEYYPHHRRYVFVTNVEGVGPYAKVFKQFHGLSTDVDIYYFYHD